jgi:hypothetical protein
MTRLLSLVLPFTAGALLHALEGLCRQPHLPALALVAFALLQPSAISFGRKPNLAVLLNSRQVSLLLLQLLVVFRDCGQLVVYCAFYFDKLLCCS